MAEDQLRRLSDRAVYSEADFARMRKEVASEMRLQSLSGEVGELRGAIGKLPTEVEAIARRVFTEQWTELRKEQGNTRWRSADTVIALGQMLIAGAVLLVALK